MISLGGVGEKLPPRLRGVGAAAHQRHRRSGNTIAILLPRRKVFRMQPVRSEPRFHALAPMNKMEIKERRTMITTVSSSSVIAVAKDTDLQVERGIFI